MARAPDWTDAEKAIVQRLYPSADFALLLEQLPRRSQGAIQAQASKMKVRRGCYWTEEEITRLKKYFETAKNWVGAKELFPGRRVDSIATQGQRLGLRFRVRAEDWTEEEDEILRTEYAKPRGKRCFEGLERTEQARYGRAVVLRLSEHPTSASRAARLGVSRFLIQIVVQYTWTASKEGRCWTLTDVEAVELLSSSCVYCGEEAGNIYKTRERETRYNGIDRVDNVIGYTVGNTVSCCFVCNRAKSTMDYGVWVSWLDQLVEFRTKKEDSNEQRTEDSPLRRSRPRDESPLLPGLGGLDADTMGRRSDVAEDQRDQGRNGSARGCFP